MNRVDFLLRGWHLVGILKLIEGPIAGACRHFSCVAGFVMMLFAAFPYQKKTLQVLGQKWRISMKQRATPSFFQMIIPPRPIIGAILHLRPLCRCIAPDLVVMGDFDKLPDSGRGEHRFVEHRKYLDDCL